MLVAPPWAGSLRLRFRLVAVLCYLALNHAVQRSSSFGCLMRQRVTSSEVDKRRGRSCNDGGYYFFVLRRRPPWLLYWLPSRQTACPRILFPLHGTSTIRAGSNSARAWKPTTSLVASMPLSTAST